MRLPRLDWRDPRHWSTTRAPCHFCGARTQSRDDIGRPAHKTCAEDALPPDETPDRLPVPNPDLADWIAELGGKCGHCGRFVCDCPSQGGAT